MKINKDLNWNKFFIRLTTLLSIIAFIIGFIIGANPASPDENEDLFGLITGLFFAIPVWVLYFSICWIYKGLHNKD